LLLALNDLRLTFRDRTSFIWMLLLPLAMMYIFGNLNYGGSGAAKASLTVVDQDGGWLARAFVADLGGDEQFFVNELTSEEAASAEDKIRTLYIPQGFTEGVLAGRQQTLRLEKDPDTSEDFALAAEVRIIRMSVRTIGHLIEMNQAGELPQGAEDEALAAERFGELGEREPLVALDVSTAGEGRPVPTGRAQSVPGMLTMSVMMMTIIYGAVFLTVEKRGGTLRRQLTLPVGRGHVFAGKLAGRLFLAALQTGVLLLAGRFLYGLSYGRSPAGLLLLVTCYCIAAAGLATFLGAVLRTPEQAGSVGWLLGMLLAALGGCWWPAEIMPRWMWQAGHVLPTTWAMDGFHALISFGYGLQSVLLPSAVLLGFGVMFSALGARFLRTAGGGA
jgi:ABC-type Na+ efflux pump permease subunit